ncbi:MAG: acyl-CoA thioesterase [Planctomycetes bacterium]|nr:acyl-CoA thioesterase [Planctomycetota bacterium]NUQ33632.1 acyl-CoA thioesterase [Planctomycetaceae bacterium]
MNMTPVKASASEAILTHIIRSEDLNMHGSLFGGKMLSLMDNCAAITAMRHSKRGCVTVSISDVSFLAPVRMGNIVTLRSRLHFTARSSMELLCTAVREDHVSGDLKEVCRAYFTFVAIDSDNQSVPVPPVELETAEDRALNAEAKARYDARRQAKAR